MIFNRSIPDNGSDDFIKLIEGDPDGDIITSEQLDGVTTIPPGFGYGWKIKEYHIPESVTKIGMFAFYWAETVDGTEQTPYEVNVYMEHFTAPTLCNSRMQLHDDYCQTVFFKPISVASPKWTIYIKSAAADSFGSLTYKGNWYYYIKFMKKI